MKKSYFLPLILVMMLPFFASATSGACSDHDGVDCSTEQLNGNVVCNDGWTGSSVSYSSMEECVGSSPGYILPVGGCTTQAEVNEFSSLIQAEELSVQSYAGEVAESEASGGMMGPEQVSAIQGAISSGNAVVANLKSLEAICQNEVDGPTQAENACTTRDSNSYYDSSTSQCACLSGYVLDPQTTVCETPAFYCTATYGQYSVPDSSSTTSCGCEQGYESLDGSCVTDSEYLETTCTAEYGQNAVVNSNGTCSVSCPSGATYNPSSQLCVMQPSNTVVTPAANTEPPSPPVVQPNPQPKKSENLGASPSQSAPPLTNAQVAGYTSVQATSSQPATTPIASSTTLGPGTGNFLTKVYHFFASFFSLF